MNAGASPEQEKTLVEGVRLVGIKLRGWRAYASLVSITGRWETADRSIVEITCDDEDRIWVRLPPDGEPLDLTGAVET